MAIKVPIVTELNKEGLTDAERALQTFGVKSTTELTKAAAGFGILAAAGTAAFAQLDAGYDAIVAATGATGEALQGLKDDAEAVAREVPDSFEDVGRAIGEVNTRLGLTGEPLQAVTQQYLELARVTGTDVVDAIQLGDRVMKDAGITAEQQSETLDMLWKASQNTGIGFDDLSRKLVQFGAPMRQLGFSIDEQIALFGAWEQQGVNTELVMGGVRQAIGRMAKAGEDVPEAFREALESIQQMESDSDATRAAIELFGQRAGPDMAAAIREGRFSIDEYVEGLQDSEGAIADTAEEMMSAQDRLKVAGNQILVAVAPAIETLAVMVEKAVSVFTSLPEPVQQSVIVLGALAVAARSAQSAFAAFGTSFSSVMRAIPRANVALGVLGAALLTVQLHSMGVAQAAGDMNDAISDMASAADVDLIGLLATALEEGHFAGKDFSEVIEEIGRQSPTTVARLIELEEQGGAVTQMLRDNNDVTIAAETLTGGWLGMFRETVQTYGDGFDALNELKGAQQAVNDELVQSERVLRADEQARQDVIDAANEETDVLQDLDDTMVDAIRTMGEQASAARDVTDAVKEEAEAQRDAQRALDDRTNAALAAVDSNLGYRQSVLSMNEAEASLTETLADAEATTAEKERALLSAETAALRMANAAVKLAEDQAAANGETLSAQQKTDLYRLELENLAGTLAPGNPLRARLLATIDDLDDFAEDRSTTLTVNYRSTGTRRPEHANVRGVDDQVRHVGGPLGSGQSAMVLGGELWQPAGGFTANQPGRVLGPGEPANAGAELGDSARTAGTGDHYHFHIGNLIGTVPDDVVENIMARAAQLQEGRNG